MPTPTAPETSRPPPLRTRHRVTFAGLIFTAITLFVMIAAISSQTNLLFLAFGLMLGGLLLSGFLSWLMLRGLEVRRVADDSAVAEIPANVHYVLTNHKRKWPVFAVRVSEAHVQGELSQTPDGYCLHVGPRTSCTMMTNLVAPRRGRVLLRAVEVTCAFPFGFLAHSIYTASEREVIVFPRVGALSGRLAMRYRETITSGAMTSARRGGNDEFYGLREYRPGDSVRDIHWRRSARTGEIVVREMTANAPPQMIVLLDLRSFRSLPAGEALAERAIELAASLLCYGSNENFAIGLHIAGLPDQAPPSARMGRDVRHQLLRTLAILNPEDLRPDLPAPEPTRHARRAEWIAVTLASADDIRSITPAGVPVTRMSLDDPEAHTWLRFINTPTAPSSPS